MNFWLKTCLYIGGSTLTGYLISNIYKKHKNLIQRKIFYYGIRTYCQYQIISNKVKIFTIPLYRKIKSIIISEQEKKNFSKIEFFKLNTTNEISDENIELLGEFDIAPELIPEKDEDTNIYMEYPVEKLKNYIKMIAPSTFDFFILKNNNNNIKDIIIRDYDNMLELDKLNYSKCEFLVLDLINGENKLSIDLTIKDLCLNFNVIGNTINKNFIIAYHKLNDLKIKNLKNYELFYVDKNINNNSISQDDGIELLYENYKLIKSESLSDDWDTQDDQYDMIHD